MKSALFFLLALALPVLAQDDAYADLDAEEHDYWNRPLKDPFTPLIPKLESGAAGLDSSSEKAFLLSLLGALDVPVSSQVMVYSTTSLQLSRISPRNPRAIYFSEQVYVGYIPQGQIEIVSIDPDVGGIFYIFDIPRNGNRIQVERSDRCMNCHTRKLTGSVPGIVIKSVAPGPTGGSLATFRKTDTGHAVPFEERFGGWHVTGEHEIAEHWGNAMGRLNGDDLSKTPLPFGSQFEIDNYPVKTSDILAHLIFEHQAGFVNRVVEAAYRVRSILAEGKGTVPSNRSAEWEEQQDILVRYLLFADEVPLPGGGIVGDAKLVEEFSKKRVEAKNGLSLRDLDLKTRIFKHRCSYMIHTPLFQELPNEFKTSIYRKIGQALSTKKPNPDYSYIPSAEKRAILQILRDTI